MSDGIYRREGKRGVSWLIKYDAGRDPVTGKRRQRYKVVKGTRKEAERERRSLLASVDDGTHVDPSKVTVAQWLDNWLEHHARHKTSPKTLERYTELATLYLKPKLGSRGLQGLAGPAIQQAYSELLTGGGKNGAPLSARTVLHVHRMLHQALAAAVKQRVMVRNPAEDCEPPKPGDADVTALDERQLTALLRGLAKGGHGGEASVLYPLVVVASGTGLRRGELLALRWADVDLEGRKLRVERSVEETKNGLRFKAPKSKRGRRTISLPENVAVVLRNHWKAQAELALALGMRLARSSLVFPSAIDRPEQPANPRALSKSFARQAAKAGLPGIGLHALRHTHATLLLAAGVNPKVVSERLGHASIAITLSVYAHVLPGMDDEAARVADALLHHS